MNNTTAVLIIVLCVALIIAGPLISIWALNTLFPALSIPYTFWTWLAALCLGGAIKSNVPVNK